MFDKYYEQTYGDKDAFLERYNAGLRAEPTELTALGIEEEPEEPTELAALGLDGYQKKPTIGEGLQPGEWNKGGTTIGEELQPDEWNKDGSAVGIQYAAAGGIAAGLLGTYLYAILGPGSNDNEHRLTPWKNRQH